MGEGRVRAYQDHCFLAEGPSGDSAQDEMSIAVMWHWEIIRNGIGIFLSTTIYTAEPA